MEYPLKVTMAAAYSSETTERVEHAGAHEAHKSDHEKLDLGGSEPKLMAADAEALVDPASGAVDVHLLTSSHMGGIVASLERLGGVLLVNGRHVPEGTGQSQDKHRDR